MNVRMILLVSLAGFNLIAGSTRAQIVASEDFEYPDGNLAGNNGGYGWYNAWVSDQGTPTVVNQQANINSTAGAQAERTIPYQGAGTTNWIRFAGQVFTTASAGVTNNTYGGFGIYDGGTELGLIGKAWPGPYRWSVALNFFNAVTTNSLLTPSVVYVRLAEDSAGTNLTADIWINPSDPSIIDTISPDVSHSFPANGWDTIRLRGGVGESVTESWKFDNLAIGATLADVAVPPAPVITSQPVSVSGYPGQNVTFSVEAAGNQPLVYQWQTNGVNLVDAGNVSGATSNVLTITGATLANISSSYTCIVTNNLGSVTSSVVSLALSTTPAFSNQTPVPNSLSVPATNMISVQIQEGNLLDTNAITMTLDAAPVTPVITQDANTFLATVSYQSGSPLSLATTHTVQVTLTDTNGASFTNTWSFNTGYPTLPVTLAGTYGPISNGDAGLVVFSGAGDGWVGTNYNSSSSRTLYTRFSMAFHDVNGEVGVGGAFGGLEFYQGGSEHLLVGNNWQAITWSLTPPDTDLNPLSLVNIDEWHTMVVKTEYSPNNNATVSVWLDPDFNQTEANQPNAPVVLSLNNTFDSIHLRCGNGTANASFSNIVVGATAPDVGFAVPAPPTFQGFVPTAGATSASPNTSIGFQVVVGSVGVDTNDITLTVDGNTVTPDFSISGSTITASYQPGSPFSAGSMHTNVVSLTDMNGTPYSTNWSFTVDPYPTLPVSLTGPFTVSGNVDTTIFTSQNGWLDGNYGGTSTNTLYTRFSMTFTDVNGETGSGGCYGGLEFFMGNTERVLIGNNWNSTNWSLTQGPNGASPLDLTPLTPIVLNEWHTMVVKSVYTSGGNTAVSIWLDPDFSKTEAEQPNPPILLSVDNTFDNIRLRCGVNTASAEFTNVVMAATAPGVGFAIPSAPQFQGFVPTAGAIAPANTSIGFQVVVGSIGVDTNDITLSVDGSPVVPDYTVSGNTITASYQPGSPFAAGSMHTNVVSLTDTNGTPYSTNWLFTVDPYPTLPVTLAGPFSVSGGASTTIFTAQNGWLDGNYGGTSTNTLYTRFSMTFTNVNGEIDNGSGGCYGGLEFYQGGTERLLVGNNWPSANWSVGAATEADLTPVTPIVLNEWHTMVVKSVYTSGGNTAVSIWLDPDFSKTEANQPNAPLALSINNTFDNLQLRCGNGTAYAEFTNIVMAATAPGVGFATSVEPALLSIQNWQLSWTGVGTLQSAPAVTGPWADATNQANPQTLSPTNSAMFFRLKQ